MVTFKDPLSVDIGQCGPTTFDLRAILQDVTTRGPRPT